MGFTPFMARLLTARRFEQHRQASQASDEREARAHLYEPPRNLSRFLPEKSAARVRPRADR